MHSDLPAHEGIFLIHSLSHAHAYTSYQALPSHAPTSMLLQLNTMGLDGNHPWINHNG